MHTGSASSAPDRSTRQEIEDKLRQDVEDAIKKLKATVSPQEKAAVAEQLREACARLNNLLLQGKMPPGI
ncbi:MAG: hypothetical protein JO323_11880 [Acidobacteriia bacterium]|nr:hypothetical protein [Terriglobia bacterium]